MTIEFEILKLSWIEHSKRIDELCKIYNPDHDSILILKKELESIKKKITKNK